MQLDQIQDATALCDPNLMPTTLQERDEAIRDAASPLPGSAPYDNYRPLNIPGRFDGRRLFDCVCELHPQIDPDQWRRWISLGHLLQNGKPLTSERRVRGGEQFWHLFPDVVEPDVNANVRVLREDDSIVALSKPAPLPCHPCGRFNRNTLSSLLDVAFSPLKLRLVHRLDANTSGVLVLAKSKKVATDLRAQFENGETSKRYLARLQGTPDAESFQCAEPIGRHRDAAGVRLVAADGLPARTQFHVLRRLDDNTTLVEAIPLTGRTNQIRAHAWSLGMPVLGDPSFLAERGLAHTQTLSPDAPPMCLHAWRLQIHHPAIGEQLELEADLPSWANLSATGNVG